MKPANPQSLSTLEYHHIQTTFFFTDTAPTQIYTLSLHDALPISRPATTSLASLAVEERRDRPARVFPHRSEEHTSELQSQSNLVCRPLLEKKNRCLGVDLSHGCLHGTKRCEQAPLREESAV